MRSLLAFLFLANISYAEPAWEIVKHSRPLAYYVDFDCVKEGISTEKIVRSGLFTPRYYYDLYSLDGAFLARGVNRVFSLGLFYPDQMEFDIYDEKAYIGYIGGHFWTHGKAKFSFANAFGTTIGFAILSSDSDQAIFSILSSNSKIVATLNGSLSGDLSRWELDVKQSLEIDPRVLKIFAAFIADFHESFIRKPEVHNHYYYYDNQSSNRNR